MKMKTQKQLWKILSSNQKSDVSGVFQKSGESGVFPDISTM